LSDQAVDLDVSHPADELVAPADSPEVRPSLGNVSALTRSIQKSIHFFFRNAVMSARSLHAANFLLVNPLFERGIAHSEHLCGFARGKEFRGWHNDALGNLRRGDSPLKPSE